MRVVPGAGALAAVAILLSAVPARAEPVPEQVTLTLEQFLKLYEDTRTREDKPEGSPLQWAISSARYAGDVVLDDGEPVSAVFDARFRVENLRKPGFWVRVPLLPATVAVRSARIGGQDAPLVLENGWYTLVTDNRGAFDVAVQFATAVSTDNGSSGLTFDLAGSGATEVELGVPASVPLDFTIENAKLKSDRTVGARRVVSATFPASGALSVRWQREIPQTQELASRVYAETHTLVGVGDGVLTARATVQETILFSGVDRVRLQVPSEMTVVAVDGAGIRDWSVSEDGVLEALLNFAAEGTYTLTVSLERVVPPGSAALDVPIVEPLGVERAKGFVGVQALGNLEVRAGQTEGTAPVDVRSLPAAIVGVTDQPVLLGFKYLGTTAKIPLAVDEHEEVDVLVTLLDQAEGTTMFTQDGRRLTSVTYQVRNNRRQFLRLALPEGAALWSASVAGRAVQPAKADDALLVPLVRSVASGGALAAFTVEVTYVESGKAPRNGRGRFEAELPRADAPTTWVGWTVYAPDRAHVKGKTYDGSLRHVRGLSRPAQAAEVYDAGAIENQMQLQTGNAMAGVGALGEGAAPVRVTLPVDGQPVYFEKLLALDERLWVTFSYKGLK
ncbi:MAG: hypothetical protein R3F59_08980 [Myxococcota bacterium]